MDVAIVGCGLSGAYIAHRLRQTHPGLSMTIYECHAHRVGGRLLSVPAGVASGDGPQFVEEFGGMRIFPQVHTRMALVVEELELELVARPLSEEANFYFDAGTQPQRKVPTSSIGSNAFDTLMDRHDVLHPGDKDKPLYEQALHSMSVQNCWETYSSGDEAGRKAWYSQLGYDGVGGISAACWRQVNSCLAEAGPTHHYQLQEGWTNVVKKLYDNTPVVFNRQLVEIEAGVRGSILHFTNGSTMRARSVFLTMPLCKWPAITGLAPGIAVRANASVINAQCTKTFLTFEKAWWTDDFGLTTGRSITTTRARMVFYVSAAAACCATAAIEGPS